MNADAGFSERLEAVRKRMADACARSDRALADVRLLPVSKTIDLQSIRSAVAAGCREFGENRVQEAMHKADALRDLDLRWSVIGHLQSNKARYVARFAHELQSLDSLKLARLLDRNLRSRERAIDVFVQVNSSGEASKYGLRPDEVAAFIKALEAFETLRFRGLMTLAVFSADEQRVRACFQRMSRLRERLRQDVLDADTDCVLSMGMSGDFEPAIEEGSDLIRVGQALFGPRAVPDSHYWPGSGP